MANEMKIPLHDYQIHAKNFMLMHPYCGLFLKMGLGKAIDDNTIIPKADGTFDRVGNIQINDMLIGKNGKPTRVIGVFHHKNKKTYSITLKDNREFICCDEHIIPYYKTANSKTILTTTAKDLYLEYCKEKRKAIYLPTNDPVEYQETKHANEDPYDMGFMLSKPDMLYIIKNGLNSTSLEIPKEYMIDSIENRRKLLKGLIDGYGMRAYHKHKLDTFGKERTDYITIATKSSKLAKNICQLCYSLGISATELPTFEFNGEHTEEYVIRIRADRYTLKSLKDRVQISFMRQVPDRNVTCFKVDAQDELFLINDYIVTHNTSIVLEGLWELDPTSHVLIIAPKTIARCTWVNEIKKWNMNLRTQSLIVNKKGKQLSKAKREEIYKTIPSTPPTVYFINREMLVDLEKHFPDKKWPFQIVIIDESQSFKTYNAERFKAMKRVRPYIKRMVLLTGSPEPQGPMDLWSQIYLLDMGKRLGSTITAYRNTFFNPGLVMNGYPVEWIPKQGAEDAIYNRISDLVISMRNDFIKLPPVTYNDMYAIMDEPELKRYKEFVKTSILELKSGEEIEAANAAVLSAKLSQMASGAIYTQKGGHDYELIHTHKLELCEYIINNTAGNIIIAYHFQSDKDMLTKYFAEKKIPAKVFDGSPEMESAWNRKEIPVLLLQPASCGFGLNLQDGGETLIWYTLPWSLEHYEQTNARIYRQGQKNPVIIHHLMTKGTIDTKILSAIKKKDLSQQRLLKAIEATINDSNTETEENDNAD